MMCTHVWSFNAHGGCVCKNVLYIYTYNYIYIYIYIIIHGGMCVRIYVALYIIIQAYVES